MEVAEVLELLQLLRYIKTVLGYAELLDEEGNPDGSDGSIFGDLSSLSGKLGNFSDYNGDGEGSAAETLDTLLTVLGDFKDYDGEEGGSAAESIDALIQMFGYLETDAEEGEVVTVYESFTELTASVQALNGTIEDGFQTVKEVSYFAVSIMMFFVVWVIFKFFYRYIGSLLVG